VNVGWLTFDDPIEVVPVGDVVDHTIGLQGEKCWCAPVIDEEGVLIHNSFDQRELFERGERKLS
jgi:hypothetical protein